MGGVEEADDDERPRRERQPQPERPRWAESTGDAAVRAEACRALEDLRARRSVEKLRSCMDDDDVRVRRAAREAVRMLGGGRR